MSSKPLRLCAVSEVPENGSNGFIIETDKGRFGAMVIRQAKDPDDVFFVYVNSCPHIGSPLDLQPGRFLNQDGTHIICTTHGALFRIDDGYCVSGPCAGANLMALDAMQRDGDIYVTLPKPPESA
jgi:nitrite reductase/ring-hydroxylating ferredoxin subunit